MSSNAAVLTGSDSHSVALVHDDVMAAERRLGDAEPGAVKYLHESFKDVAVRVTDEEVRPAVRLQRTSDTRL